jgi:heme A synthase
MAAPPVAFFHNNVHNPYVHAVLDVLTLAVATSPLWTAYFWGGQRRALLLALVAVVQVPVAVIGFFPAVNPAVHAATFVGALVLTGFSLALVRRSAQAAATAQEPAPARVRAD